MKKPMHFRRCHVCSQTTTRTSIQVNRCDHCGKSLAPFYYFDDRFTSTQGDLTLRPPLMAGEVQPIQGLTVYWESF